MSISCLKYDNSADKIFVYVTPLTLLMVFRRPKLVCSRSRKAW